MPSSTSPMHGPQQLARGVNEHAEGWWICAAKRARIEPPAPRPELDSAITALDSLSPTVKALMLWAASLCGPPEAACARIQGHWQVNMSHANIVRAAGRWRAVQCCRSQLGRQHGVHSKLVCIETACAGRGSA